MGFPVYCAQEDPHLNIRPSSAYFDDFYGYLTTQNGWTTLSSGGGTTALSATTDQVVCTTGAGSGDYQGFASTQPLFLPSSGVGMYAEAFINTANLTDPAIFFGFSSAPGAVYNSPTADPSGSASAAVIYALQGDTQFRFLGPNGTNYVLKTVGTTCPFANGTTNPAVNHVLRVDVTNWSAADALVTFTVDNVIPLYGTGIQIQAQLPYASLAQMKVFAQITSGGSADVLNVDYVSMGKYRPMLS